MITPIFTIDQDEGFLLLYIKAPHSKPSDAEIAFLDNEFHFSAKPYFLRLHLPGRIVQNGSETISWDADSNTYKVKAPKETFGEKFYGLDMITKLLIKPRDTKQAIRMRPSIELVASQSQYQEDSDDEFDWLYEQNIFTENDASQLLNGHKYGFANNYTGVIARLGEEFGDLFEIRSVEKKDFDQRRRERLDCEQNRFSEEHYLADMYEESVLESLISSVIGDECYCFSNSYTEEELFRLKNLPKKIFLFSKTQRYTVILGLIDILYAIAYDGRTTQWESTVESAWTISRLSSQLSWMDSSFTTIKDVLVASVRRSLCYPLYRNWNLSMKVLQDVKQIMQSGRKTVLRLLLHAHKIFNSTGDYYYILNDLYITDYCVWIQDIRSKTLTSISDALNTISISKEAVNLELSLLEYASELVMRDSESTLEKSVDHIQAEKLLDSDDDTSEEDNEVR